MLAIGVVEFFYDCETLCTEAAHSNSGKVRLMLECATQLSHPLLLKLSLYDKKSVCNYKF